MQYADKTVEINEGNMHVIPKSVMHSLVADEESLIILIQEPATKVKSEELSSDGTYDFEEQMQSVTHLRDLIQTIAGSH